MLKLWLMFLVPVVSGQNETNFSNVTAMEDEAPDYPLEEVHNNLPYLEQGAASNPRHDYFQVLINKHLPLDYLRPENLLRPISQKITEISNFFSHPNYGLLFPLWTRLEEKKKLLFPSHLSSIFGAGQWGGHDYPFAYRKRSD